MGNSVSRVVGCFMPVGNEQERVGLVFSEPLDEGLGHSFCYVRPVIESARYSPSQSDRFGILDPEGLEPWENSRSFRFTEDNEKSSNPSGNPNANLNPKLAETTFKAISGASVSANTSTPRTVVAAHDHATTFANPDRASAFEGTASFSALPLQPVPRGPNGGGGSFSGPMSGPLQQQADRSFMSAPLERGGGFLSGPLERGAFVSGPLENMDRSQYFSAPLGGTGNHMTLFRRRRRYLSRFMRTVSKPVRSVISRTQRSWVLQLVGWQQSKGGGVSKENATYDSGMFPSEDSSNNNLQWAQGKAGEDRVHVVLSEEHGWLFVGIYDGFNGPDAPEFLMCNLYKAIFNELEGLLWDRKPDCADSQPQQQDSAKPQECPHAQSGHQNLTHPVEDCHCPYAQSGQNNHNNPLKDCHCPHAQSATQANTIHPKHPEAVKRDCPDAQPAPGLNNPNRSQAPEASQEDSHHPEAALQNRDVTRENSSHALSALQLNPEATQEDQSALQSNPDHTHCREATKQDSSHAQYRTKQNGNDPGSQNAAHSPARQNNSDLQDLDVKDADLEVGNRNTSTSQREKLEVNARQHPSNEIDNEDPEGTNRETSIDVSRTDPKKQGDDRPLTEFIKRVTFECEKKGVGECRKGRSLRELLAEEEDDPFDIFLWNSSTNMIHRSRQNSSSGSVVATAGGSRLVSEGSVETREGNGASDQIADTRGRRVGYSDSEQKQGRGRSLLSSKLRQAWRKESHRKLFPWRYDWEKERIEVEKKLDEGLKQDPQRCKAGSVDHVSVLKALSRALEVTEEAYLEMTDKVLDENPELALMGSCLLVMLMKDQDVYVMNVGDSRAIVAQQRPGTNSSATQHCSYQNGDREERVGLRDSLVRSELEGITEEPSAESASVQANTNTNANGTEAEIPVPGSNLIALQLSTDHSTSIEEEVLRIKAEHPDDNQSILNDRVKGRLKVTRAFGAGFLKQPKWNDALLEMFRNDYIGTAPYITCTPSLRHHRLGPNDQFLVLSSDGLYQYLSNQEVVSHVELFMEKNPEADPAQHLIEELLFRAAKKAGMNFRELLDIPQGDRRKYHDDVTVMVISLEGRIWKSSGKYI